MSHPDSEGILITVKDRDNIAFIENKNTELIVER
jgi:hypothetical protein